MNRGTRRIGVSLKSPILFILCVLAFTALQVPLLAQVADRSVSFIDVPVWVHLDPMYPQSGQEYPISRDRAARRALEEARYIIGGMVYGFTFTYVPSDNARGMQEHFQMEPRAEIPWGDSRVTVLESWVEESTFHIRVRYRLADFEQARLASWRSGAIPERAASGEAPMWDGPSEKITAIRNASKQAIRSHLRGLTRNKPREARGKVLFCEAPRVYVDSGAYHADVRLKLRIDEVRGYEVF